MGEGVREIPSSQIVKLQHPDGGEEKAEEPKKSAGVTEAQIKLEKRRQQEHR